MTYIPRKMLEFSVFWDLNISGRKHSSKLKFSGYSIDKQSCMWAKSQVEMPSFDFLVRTMPYAKIPVKWL